jgi:translation initiation factor 2B subunit (eIF-2B alpha/beta/delta family)
MEQEKRSYENICKHIGKMVLDYHFDMEKLANQFQKALEDFKANLEEKNQRIKELEAKQGK